ncbi:MAG: hypothetical protein WC998_08900 [Candidatus Paceibacterota bacterium]|jgi:hypothetical protein
MKTGSRHETTYDWPLKIDSEVIQDVQFTVSRDNIKITGIDKGIPFDSWDRFAAEITDIMDEYYNPAYLPLKPVKKRKTDNKLSENRMP